MSKKQKRDIQSYIQSANELSRLAPSLKKYKRRKKLTRWEKGAITRKERVLRYARNLMPVTKKQAKKMKGMLYAPGVQAIALDNTSSHATLNLVRKDIFVTSNGRTWMYWKLDRYQASDMIRAGTVAFKQIRQAFPLEQIAELAERAFARLKTKEVYLWTVNGRVGDGFQHLQAFMAWVKENWAGYEEPETWVRGIAIRL